jgi:hypothetical protein
MVQRTTSFMFNRAVAYRGIRQYRRITSVRRRRHATVRQHVAPSVAAIPSAHPAPASRVHAPDSRAAPCPNLPNKEGWGAKKLFIITREYDV